MFPRILTDLERKRIKAFVRHDREKNLVIRNIVFKAKQNLPMLKADLDLLIKLIERYDNAILLGKLYE